MPSVAHRVTKMSWSPDGLRLAISTAKCGDELVKSSTVYVWDSEKDQTTVLMETDGSLLFPEYWIGGLELRIGSEKWNEDEREYEYTIYEYDLAIGETVLIGTATPRP